MTEREESTDREETTGQDRMDLSLRVGATAGGAGLAGSYAVPWVDVTGQTFTAGSPGAISARELAVLPELVAVLGVLAVLLAALYWTTRARLVVLAIGLTGTGVSLFGRFFLDGDADAIRLGGHTGPPSSFEPGLGLTVALLAALVLVAASFLALLRELPDAD